jgi:hypothetical protein
MSSASFRSPTAKITTYRLHWHWSGWCSHAFQSDRSTYCKKMMEEHHEAMMKLLCGTAVKGAAK